MFVSSILTPSGVQLGFSSNPITFVSLSLYPVQIAREKSKTAKHPVFPAPVFYHQPTKNLPRHSPPFTSFKWMNDTIIALSARVTPVSAMDRRPYNHKVSHRIADLSTSASFFIGDSPQTKRYYVYRRIIPRFSLGLCHCEVCPAE